MQGYAGVSKMTTSNNPIRCPKCQGELAEASNFCPDCGEPIEAVVFADKNLEAAVRVELGIPEGTLTRENLKRLDKLTTNIEGKPSQLEFIVKDLLGLEHAVNLTKVNIIYGQISDLSPLSLLTNLTFLGLPSNIISDISPLASLTNLKDGLVLSDNLITDISPLASLPNLTALLLSDNQIIDISPLALIAKLDYLELATNPLNREAIDVYAPILESKGVGVNL